MAAYTAVISLLQTLEQLQLRNPQLIHAKTLESLHATAQYFHKVLEESSCNSSRFDLEKLKYLEEKIRVAASTAEDVVELEICQIMEGLSWDFLTAPKLPGLNLLPVVEMITTTTKEVMEIVSEFTMVTSTDHHSLIGTSSRSSNSPMPKFEDDIVQGLDEDLEIIVNRLTGPTCDLDIVMVTGMGGIGKTTLARKAYDHPDIRYHFDIFVWVTISQEFRTRIMLLEALHCISKHTNIVKDKDYDKMGDDELAVLVQNNLKGRRYLVVVDDIWSTNVWDHIRGLFPEYNNRSRILLTTRETEVALYVNPISPHEMNFLNLDNCWMLLRDKVFGPKRDHPPELEEIGKEMVEKCQGLPLTITVIAGHLSKTARTLESWKDVAQTLGEIVTSHGDKCSEVLGLSYHHLPNRLKPCFLSMGGFPEDFQVEARRLIQLWIAEGFIRTSGRCKSLEDIAEDYLEDLISRNLIMVRKRRFNGEIKACVMHDLLRDFCLREAEMTQFMHVERTHGLVPTLPTQKHNVCRRFSFQTQPFSVKNGCKQLSAVARSFHSYRLCQLVQPSAIYKIFSCFYHLVPSLIPRPLVFEVFISRFNLLRVLAIYGDHTFLSFPLVITKLFHLRYLAVTCDANLPASISELQNLQTLIYLQPQKFKEATTLPGEIWMMKNLRHIYLRDSCYLPTPQRIGKKHLVIGMPNLEELSAISSASCTSEVFSGTPNLKRLIINSIPNPEDMNQLFDMSSLRKLEALKFLTYFGRPSIKRFIFPTSLKRLTLALVLLTWEDISTLCMLPNLEELKLKRNAARDNVWGDGWRLSDEDKFPSLKLLLISKPVYFLRWEASSDSFPNLKRLVLKNCKVLQEIPMDFGEICTLESIELHNCGTRAEDSARKIEQEQEDMGNNTLKVYIHK